MLMLLESLWTGKKFFDFLQYEAGFHLLQRLGAPEGVITAAKSMYKDLRCCFKFRKATTGFSKRDMALHKETASPFKLH